jgi:hypothetical protein
METVWSTFPVQTGNSATVIGSLTARIVPRSLDSPHFTTEKDFEDFTVPTRTFCLL